MDRQDNQNNKSSDRKEYSIYVHHLSGEVSKDSSAATNAFVKEYKVDVQEYLGLTGQLPPSDT